jgi:hypothetical protein
MISNEIRQKLQNIVRGTLFEEQEDSCTAIRNLLCRSFEAGPTVKREFESKRIIKEKQASFLEDHSRKLSLWMDALPTDCKYLAKGGEATVYLTGDNRNVIKANDAVYYATWLEYFDSVVIHNLLFPDTSYYLVGFTRINDALFAVVQQPFVQGESADLNDIKELLVFNEFENTRRQDYLNKEFGLLLEDMHDENVIAKDGSLFFIDTVFYIMEGKK